MVNSRVADLGAVGKLHGGVFGFAGWVFATRFAAQCALNRAVKATLTLVVVGSFAGAMGTEVGVPDTKMVAKLASPSTLPDGWQQGAFMEIFVRAYKDTNGDGIGDLKGVTQSLDYLQTLGVKGI